MIDVSRDRNPRSLSKKCRSSKKIAKLRFKNYWNVWKRCYLSNWYHSSKCKWTPARSVLTRRFILVKFWFAIVLSWHFECVFPISLQFFFFCVCFLPKRHDFLEKRTLEQRYIDDKSRNKSLESKLEQGKVLNFSKRKECHSVGDICYLLLILFQNIDTQTSLS